MSNGPHLPSTPEESATGTARGRRPAAATNAAGLTGWPYVIDRMAERLFAPSFLAFLLVMATLITALLLISGTSDLDRILKVWAFVGPLVGGYVGHAFTKAK